jgi:hypothetical protein
VAVGVAIGEAPAWIRQRWRRGGSRGADMWVMVKRYHQG